jgi:4-methylaminobutanoate oxidase (formaldehyde-forming)
LGWEIFVTPDMAEHVFDVLFEAGQAFGLRLLGGEALNALRIEKGFVHWGHDMAYTEAPHQIGLEFVCKPDKSTPFVGREAYLERKAQALGPFLCSIKLADPEPMLHHNEPVLRDGEVVGYVTSGSHGYIVGSAVGLCFISLAEGETDKASLLHGRYSVRVEGAEIPAEISMSAFHDPQSKRMLG